MKNLNLQQKAKNLPKGWRKVKLGEVAEIKMGQSPSSRFYNSERKGLPFFQGVTDFGEKYPKESVFCSRPIKIAEVGEILISVRAPVGEVNITIEKCCIGRGIAALSMKNGLNSFLYFLLRYSKADLKSIAGGTTYEAITKNQLENFEIEIPEDPNEQKRITDILSAFDDKIELNNKINQILEEMAQAIFKEWFVKSEKLKMKSEKLSNLVDTQYGYTQTANDKEIGPKFLRVKDINKTDWIDWNSVPYCRIEEENFKKYKLKKGDIVIARMADPGKVGIIEREINAVFGSYLIRLQIKSSKITPYFLYYYLKSPLYQNFILGVSTGTTRKSINARMMVNCNILIPPREILEKFEMMISKIRQKINLNLVENQKLSALRDLLLPKLMSGEVRV